MIPVGLVGAGTRAAEVYAPALETCPEVDFVAVWARSAEPVRRLAERHGAVPCPRFEDLLERCSAVVFAVPPPVQVDYATSAMRHGCAVLLEKPIGGDVSGAEQLTSVALREKVPTTVALAWRHTEDVRRFLATDAPDVDPVGGVGRVLSGTPDGGASAPPWRRARGVLRTYAADLLDLLEAALGPVVGMHAHGDPRTWVGMSLDHSVGRFSEASLYGGRPPGTDVAVVEISGPRGTAGVEALAGLGPSAYQRMVAEFAGVVADGRPHGLGIEHGLHLQRLVESAETDLVLHG
ncbi:Gfo/Idh/MocA family oxidoreductase [Blastococcus sp. CT_GayMR20]|uniref:Gfo/Idh/MocA family protein n=1 Tax=Blastococcus sp. CT_GayMR20 TaxID=2559609 RepID=UPI00107474DF|nr:Gfo/Idh/MocA family oxidoreductase [Blastococcus sp. CT_GayMR20]TFV90124.1 Gfo/Idh/MocA family oxidoreductase [Blastococcus sp. CT_GayMR20]